GEADVQRRAGGGIERFAWRVALPVVIEKTAGPLVPQPAVDRGASPLRARRKRLRLPALSIGMAELGDLPLQLVQECIEIHRQDRRGADRLELAAVAPARTEIPAGRGARAQVAIHLGARPRC